MPAQRTFTSISSAFQASLCQEYDHSLQCLAVGFNVCGCMYACQGGDLYPTIKEVHNQSNTTVPDDDEFEDLGLNDFIMAQCLIACHRVERRREFMSIHTCGLIACSPEEWDVDDEPHSVRVHPNTLNTPVRLEPVTSSLALPAYSTILDLTITLHSSRLPSLQGNPSAAFGFAQRLLASCAWTLYVDVWLDSGVTVMETS